jgi:protein-disulfide isomerase
VKDRLERVLSVLLAISAVAVAITVVYRQVAPAAPPQTRSTRVTVSFVSDWRALLAAGHQVSNADAPVQLIEFIDLECPACQAFASTLKAIRLQYGSRLGVTMIHFPLPMHRFARKAARVAECGGRQGRFDEIVSSILDSGDSVRAEPWLSLGMRSGIGDSALFRACQADTSEVKAIEQGIAAGSRIGVNATPTLIVSGWKFDRTPSEQNLKETIDALLSGRKPPNRT